MLNSKGNTSGSLRPDPRHRHCGIENAEIEQLILAIIAASLERRRLALQILRGKPALVAPKQLRVLTGWHERTLIRRGLKPRVRGGGGHANRYDLEEAMALAQRGPKPPSAIRSAPPVGGAS